VLVDRATVAASPVDGLVLHGAAESSPLAASVERGVARLFGFYRPDAEEGPGALVRPASFARALRHLVDALLGPALDDGGGALQLDVASTAGLWPALYPERLGLAASEDEPDVLGPPPELLVILGCGRSGTTWLERLLMAHPLAGGADATESFVFAQTSALWAELGRADGLSAWFDHASLATELRGFLDEVFAAALARHRPGATVFVEKTPKHTLVIPEIRAVVPDAHYLHLVRDGRDVARSASSVPFFECPTPADGAALWEHAVSLVRRDASSARHYRELRYEDLLADPIGSVRSLWSWLGLEPTTDADAELRARIAPRVSRHAGTAQAVGAGTWQRLGADELARVYAEAGRLLVSDGYATRATVRRAMVRPAYWRRRLQRARRRRTPTPR
jgi:LPS sulfotransferase NodH